MMKKFNRKVKNVLTDNVQHGTNNFPDITNFGQVQHGNGDRCAEFPEEYTAERLLEIGNLKEESIKLTLQNCKLYLSLALYKKLNSCKNFSSVQRISLKIDNVSGDFY